MRNAPNVRLEQIRLDGPPDSNYGTFRDGGLLIRVSAGGGWDHVSVSRPDRTPMWEEMDRVKRLCFRDDEIVVQFHVNDGRKNNICVNCLHLWRPQTAQEIAAERKMWEASGKRWPYGELEPALPLVLPRPEMV